MERVFINAISAKSAGGKYIINNFMDVINESKDSYYFIVVIHNEEGIF